MLEKLQTRAFDQTIDSMLQAPADKQGTYHHLITGLDGSAKSIFIAELYKKNPRQLLIIEPNRNRRQALYDDLNALLPQNQVLSFPCEENVALEYSTASFDGIAQRVETLQTLISGEKVIVVAGVNALRKRLMPIADWKDNQLILSLGCEITRDDLERKLFNLAYQRVDMVQSPGEYSIRGSIIDYYPLNSEHPIRLDFFDTELDSIRYFDAQTQTSLENINEVMLEPVKDILFNQEKQLAVSESIKEAVSKQVSHLKDADLVKTLSQRMNDQLEDLAKGGSLVLPEAFLSFYDTVGTSLLDYMEEGACLLVSEFDRVHQEELHLIESDQFWIEDQINQGNLLPGQKLHLSAFDQIKGCQKRTVYLSLIQKGLGKMKFSSLHSFQYRSMTPFFNQMALVKPEIDHWLKEGRVIQVVVDNKERAKKLEQIFNEYQIQPIYHQQDEKIYQGAINVLEGHLTNGFELPLDKWVVITEKELFNRIKKHQAKRQKLSNAERIKSYNELEVGDYVVHVNHGIGRYIGMETMEISGVHRDLIAIEYQQNAKVMIPVDQIHLIQKYVSSGEAKTPKLHKLGGSEWVKTKQKVSSKIEDIADELIELYAKREQEKGYAFSMDTPEQLEFEKAFPYIETPDQLQTSSEIKKDMEKDRPMDRLLVGDVGYGKTEVAMRAIFKAVMDGKQVAFLVPTTILAQQHYQSLLERFADYPFEIRMLSRFASQKEQKETIKGLKTGACQVVVGTHRLLSKDVTFLDLGLMVVDEEQRFGVKHKERLKQLKSQVDVLTLTATPIPRTLHMAMVGVRDLSVIETPPSNRYPVQTYVMEQNEAAIKFAIEREIDRGGQCFYLYNRVASIYHRADQLSQLVPEARVAVAHGQMSEVELENVLYEFIQGNYDVLVTTTIIETGVDIPNVNTLFIEKADRMGLSTLYQLRGRVGRTNRLAYAYLMYDPMKQLSEISEKRLNAIREFTELGSGFKIAMRDLSIRGAGNLLGSQQSGFIDSVGFDLYSQMLREAIDRRQGKQNMLENLNQSVVEIDLSIDAYIPDSYISDERQKIAAYKMLQKMDGMEEYREIQDQWIDRYGEFPDEVANLLDIALLRYYASRSGVLKLTRNHQSIVVMFNSIASQYFYGPKVYEALENVKAREKVILNKDQLQVKLLVQGKEADQILSLLIKFMSQASDLLQNHKEQEQKMQETFKIENQRR
ncbi:transcription-repair coupling factor [Facklamia hominis]|uniref:transcription-repair coupling factor n=1 Tax=Facklamia hominis TaxID=178214 RepID=UPI00288AC7FC|nr:transcription-repair coupling factor [Facklamia hominis]